MTQPLDPQSSVHPNDNSPGAQEMRELEALLDIVPKRKILIDGKTIEFQIKKVKAGKIPLLIKAAGPLMVPLTDPRMAIDLGRLMTHHTSECLDVLAVLTNQPREVIDELELDDMLILFGDCITLNIDFFVRRVLPLFSGGLQRLLEQIADQKEKLLSLAGQTPPKS